MEHCDIVIVGAGAAGIAAARSAHEAGCKSILLVDSKQKMGGVLLQCAHHGFGPQLTGVEYVQKLLEQFPKEIKVMLGTTVVSVSSDRTVVLSSPSCGLQKIRFEQLILAAGCQEIPIGALPVGGTRPEGLYTAGQVQELVNICHKLPKGPSVILGSGDLGLIMAEQLSLEGVKVAAMIEQKAACGGLARNQRCLEKYHIPLLCFSTVTEVLGQEVLSAVKISRSDTEEEQIIPCSSLLVAVGLRPDRSLLLGLGSPDWIHLCGNCHRVHPMVEAVTAEGKRAGADAFERMRK